MSTVVVVLNFAWAWLSGGLTYTGWGRTDRRRKGGAPATSNWKLWNEGFCDEVSKGHVLVERMNLVDEKMRNATLKGLLEGAGLQVFAGSSRSGIKEPPSRCLPCHTNLHFSHAVQYPAQREDKSVCVLMLDGTPDPRPEEHWGLHWEFPASRSKRVITIFFLAFIFIAAVLFTSRDVFPKCHQRLQREEHFKFDIVGNNAISSSQPQLYRSSFHFQPPKNWMNDPSGFRVLLGAQSLISEKYAGYRMMW